MFSRIYVPSRVLCQVAAKITAETITNIPTFSGVDKVASAEHADIVDHKSFLHFAPYVRLRCFMCESLIVRRIPIRNQSFFGFLSKSNIRDDRSSIRRCTQQNFFFGKICSSKQAEDKRMLTSGRPKKGQQIFFSSSTWIRIGRRTRLWPKLFASIFSVCSIRLVVTCFIS